MATLVKLPKWGLTMESATITEWLCAQGSSVQAGDPLFVAETDKAAHDVAAPSDGVLRRVVATEGSSVAVGGAVAVLTEPGESLTDDEVEEFLASQAAPARPLAGVARTAAPERRRPRAADRDERGRVRASPAARKLALELGVDLQTVTATGPGGRITSEDVQRAVSGDGEPDVRQDWVRLADGRRIFYILAGPPGVSPIVFIHGLAGSSSTWQSVLGPFAETHQVLALDLPGHGQSDAADPAAVDYSISGLAAVVRELLGTLDLSSITLVGHSLGGPVAAATALAQPDAVSRLVLVDSAGIGRDINPRMMELVTGPPSAAAARDLLNLFFYDGRFVLDSGVDEYQRAWARPGADAAIRAVANGAFDSSSQQVTIELESLRQPVLVVWGAEDRVIPVEHAHSAGDATPVSATEIIPDIGHVPQLEAVPQFIEVVERFIAQA
jgi:pyruvate dehydrogenase E2 component (dihydrolipoamide acetyltransferase)